MHMLLDNLDAILFQLFAPQNFCYWLCESNYQLKAKTFSWIYILLLILILILSKLIIMLKFSLLSLSMTLSSP